MAQQFFEELSRCLRKEQIESYNKEDRRLEIFLHGQPVLSVSPGNEVFLLPAGSKNPEANELYHRVAIAADSAFEYVEAMENTPLLRACGLENKFHLLADFGGAVLAGRERAAGQGYEFVTWIWDYEKVGVSHGHYGVVYDNGMCLSQVYDGRHFPQYFYEPPLLTLTVQESKGAPQTWLYLPAPDLQIKRSLIRAGIVDPADMELSFQASEFPDAVDCVLDMKSESLEELNKLCRSIQRLSTNEIKKLGAVVEYAQPETAAQVRQLAENLDQFDYAPGVQNVEEYGRYMIQESGRFEYDENLRDYYDYARYGLERMNAEEGRVVKSGYVSYHGVLTLEELMMDNPAEQYQRNQGFNFQMT